MRSLSSLLDIWRGAARLSERAGAAPVEFSVHSEHPYPLAKTLLGDLRRLAAPMISDRIALPFTIQNRSSRHSAAGATADTRSIKSQFVGSRRSLGKGGPLKSLNRSSTGGGGSTDARTLFCLIADQGGRASGGNSCRALGIPSPARLHDYRRPSTSCCTIDLR